MADEARAQKRKLSASEGNFFIGGDDDAAEDERSVNFEISCWSLQIGQKTNEIFVRISALTSKKRSNRDTLYHQLGVILWYKCAFIF